MSRSFVFGAILCVTLPAVASAATSQMTRTLTVQKPCEQVAKWYETRRAELLAASNCRVVTTHADHHYTVETNTPAGPSVYLIRETRKEETTSSGKRITFHIQFVRNVRGRVADQDLTITLTQRQNRSTEIVMAMTTSVEGKFIPTMAVRSVQGKCLDGSERFIKSEL
jgi:hypothetical protein